jgi:CO/xanthine dehydrogenase Mo-binding subunit
MSVIGSPLLRIDAAQKAAGLARYTADIALPGMLVGQLLRSPHPHALIHSIDVSRAERLSGVRAVVHGNSFANPLYGPALKDASVFPRSRARFVGEPVAAVAAVDAETAAEALTLIHVEYEPLLAVFDTVAAMAPGAPILHPELPVYETYYPDPIKYGNVAMYCRASLGDVESGLGRADRVFHHTFTTPTTYGSPIEPHATVVRPEGGGRATIWTTTQQPFVVRNTVAEIFGVAQDELRVIVPNLGGGFGAKEYLLLEPFCYMLAMVAGAPVKMVATRAEEFQTGNPRHASRVELTTGVMTDGTLVARRAVVIYDTGAYTGQGPYVTASGLVAAFGPYRIEHREGEAFCVYTNKPNSGSYRGYGFPQATFAGEAQIDLIAADLGMDPLEFRLKNIAQDGDTVVTGQRLRAVGLRQALIRAAEAAGWAEKRGNRRPFHGIGIACGHKAAGLGPTNATVTVHENGTATVSCGTVDLGTGSSTVLAQFVAEELGLPAGQVCVNSADTGSTPFDLGSIASRSTFGMNAVRLAAGDARQALVATAAAYWGCDPGDVEYRDGRAHEPRTGCTLNVGELASLHVKLYGGLPAGAGMYLAGANETYQPEALRGFPLGPIPHYVFGAQTAEVTVDPETGQVTVLRLVAAHDVGKAINPLNVRGQIEGGLLMGMSGALYEEMIFDQGRVLNANLADFKIPTAMDIPEVQTIIVEEPDPEGPYGAKGLGEATVIPTMPAIANAVFDATGVMIHDMPITAEKLLDRMNAVEAAGPGA